jgi:hypothetical protein
MNLSINDNTKESSNVEDDYGFFCEFDQTISTDYTTHTNQRNYKIDKTILKKLNDKYKYTVLNKNLFPMLTTIPTYYNFNLYKNRSPKSSKVMPILDEDYVIEKNNLQYNTKENTRLNYNLCLHSIFILSFCVSILIIFL